MARKKVEDDRPVYESVTPANLVPMGAEDKAKDQGNLLAAKQSPAFPLAGGLIAYALKLRGERIMLDYGKAGVAVKCEVDGVWMNSEPLDRQAGDAMLMVLKKLANLEPAERRARQDGVFGADHKSGKFKVNITAQGVKTGERVVLKFTPKKARFETLEELGMRPKMRQQFKELIDQNQGLVILSAPPGNGLTTLWKIGLNTADRFVRDFISIEEKAQPEDEIINVGPVFFDASKGQAPADILPRLLLKQPDVFIVPNMVNGETVRMLCEQVNKHHKMVVTRVSAKDAIEALMAILALKGPSDQVAEATTFVLNGRLIRKLCEKCKQPFQPTPQMLQ